jgi:hypothetical protein
MPLAWSNLFYFISNPCGPVFWGSNVDRSICEEYVFIQKTKKKVRVKWRKQRWNRARSIDAVCRCHRDVLDAKHSQTTVSCRVCCVLSSHSRRCRNSFPRWKLLQRSALFKLNATLSTFQLGNVSHGRGPFDTQ